MEEPVDLFGQRWTDTGAGTDVTGTGQLDGIDGMEVGQQVFDPFGPKAWNVAQA